MILTVCSMYFELQVVSNMCLEFLDEDDQDSIKITDNFFKQQNREEGETFKAA